MAYKYIFSINTGRSGSKYLYSLFEGHPGVASYHEALPILNGAPMREWLKGNKTPMRKEVPQKMDSIQKGLGNKPIYLDTTNCFIKGFGWEILENIPHEEVAVIVLNREKKGVVSSYYRIDSHQLNTRGQRWLISPSLSGYSKVSFGEYLRYILSIPLNKIYSVINNHLFGKRLKDIFKEYKLGLLGWYVDKVTELTEDFFVQFPDIKRIDLHFAELNDPGIMQKLCESIGAEFTPALEAKIGRKVNDRAHMH